MSPISMDLQRALICDSTLEAKNLAEAVLPW